MSCRTHSKSLRILSSLIHHHPMNKSELIARVALDTKLTRSEAAEVLDATLEAIMRALAEGDDVRITGFGVFTISKRAAGKARNPRTGKIIKVAPFTRARFKPGKLLKEAVNRKRPSPA
jgi:DNA-binding protein HU-beta